MTSIAYLRQVLAETMYGTRCEVLLAISLEEARRRVSPTDGTLLAAGEGTLLTFGADDMDWAASYLAGLECDLVVIRPRELRASLRTIAQRLQAAARGAKRRRAGALPGSG